MNEIILDATCYGRLLDPATYRKVTASARTAGHTIWPTAANVFEVLKYDNVPTRDRLLGLIHRLREDRALLPWPDDLLGDIAHALARREPRVRIAPDFLDAAAYDPSILTPARLRQVRHVFDKIDPAFKALIERGRRETRKLVKAHGGKNPWPTARDFLDEWGQPQNLAWYVDRELAAAKLTAKQVPHDVLLNNPEWRIHFDTFGIVVYRQLVGLVQPRWVGRTDLRQLVYLGHPGSIFVSSDAPLLEASRGIIEGRYENRRIMSWDELLAAA